MPVTDKKHPKIENVLEIIRKCIEENRYTSTTHALIRQQERKISVSEVVHVLKTGYEEKNKTCFDNNNNIWKYAIRGKTKLDKLDVRVIVTFDENRMLIVTVMYVEKL
jgi:Domain of unknown function (DUF4258)